MPIAVVLGIARLGEVDLRGWWRSHAMGQPGEFVLGGGFPRTWQCTALELDILSAARRHEDVLKRPTAAHLFSDWLPFRRRAVAWLAERKTSSDRSFIERLAGWDIDAARAEIGTWVGETAIESEVVGPGLRLGSLDTATLAHETNLVETARRLAVHYLDKSPEFRPPYFDLVP